MAQHEITSKIPLLDKDGNLTEAGYAKKLLPVYRRADIKASPLRICSGFPLFSRYSSISFFT